jgi:glyoxylase-like metal-dependent hydrolase (beta-lactamase superfamily II)
MPALEVLNNLFFCQRGYLNANHFVYRSPHPVLIDTGYCGGFEDTRRAIESLGIDLADIATIINTHTHCDHVGGNHAIQTLSACEVALHPIGRHFIDTRDDWSTWWRYFGQQADFFECTRSLEDGEEICVGEHVFQVLHTPGHAADGMVLYHRKARLLLSSDTLWENDVATINLRVEGSAAVFQMLESLDRIATLPVSMVFPGHGHPFDDFSSALARARQRLEGYLEDRQRIGNDLLKKLFVYTLLMKQAVEADRFFELLMNTQWYRETVDFYFDGAYRATYEEVVERLVRRKVMCRSGGEYTTTVPP